MANVAIDRHCCDIQERDGSVRNTAVNSALSGNGFRGRMDLGGILQWGSDSMFFRSVLNHSILRPYFEELLGKGYRMDHQPFLILQDSGSEGFSLHGGTIDCRSGSYNPELAYTCVNQHMRCSLLAVSVALVDHNPGDGGFVVVPGSHKSNFCCPAAMITGDGFTEFVVQPTLKAGDVILFSEGTVHGARPWMNTTTQRRIALYRFAPATCCYGRSYYPSWPAGVYTKGDGDEGLTETQLAVLEPPYATRIDRPTLISTADGGCAVEVCRRAEAKKSFDKKVFGSEYF